MSWGPITRNAVDRLMTYMSQPERGDLTHDQAEQIWGMDEAAQRVVAMLDDPPGPSSLNCLRWAESPTVARTVAYAICQGFFDEIGALLADLAYTGRRVFPGDPVADGLAEVVESRAESVSTFRSEAGGVLGAREGCMPPVIEYPFGFGDSCEPTVPIWLYGVGALYVVSVFR